MMKRYKGLLPIILLVLILGQCGPAAAGNAPQLIRYGNGSYYIGEMTGGQYDGVGLLLQPGNEGSGYFYVGEWKNGLRHGRGIVVTKDMWRHEGTFVDNAMTEGNSDYAPNKLTLHDADSLCALLLAFESDQFSTLGAVHDVQEGNYYIGGFKDYLPEGIGFFYDASLNQATLGRFEAGAWAGSMNPPLQPDPFIPAPFDPFEIPAEPDVTATAISSPQPAMPPQTVIDQQSEIARKEIAQAALRAAVQANAADAAAQDAAAISEQELGQSVPSAGPGATTAPASHSLPTMPPQAVTLPPQVGAPTPQPTPELPAEDYFAATIDGMSYVYELFSSPIHDGKNIKFLCLASLIDGQPPQGWRAEMFTITFPNTVEAGAVYTQADTAGNGHEFSFIKKRGAGSGGWSAYLDNTSSFGAYPRGSFRMEITSRDRGHYIGTLEAVLEYDGDEHTLTDGRFHFTGR